jgi:hypothetical protein
MRWIKEMRLFSDAASLLRRAGGPISETIRNGISCRVHGGLAPPAPMPPI